MNRKNAQARQSRLPRFAVSALLGYSTLAGVEAQTCREGEVRYQGGCIRYNPRWREELDGMREGVQHFEQLAETGQQRLMMLRGQLEDKQRGRRGGSGSRSRSGDRDRPGPGPGDPWRGSGCAGEKLARFTGDGPDSSGTVESFQQGMDMCFAAAEQVYAEMGADIKLCCRCDNGDDFNYTDRCWLHEGEMEPDKDYAFMVNGESEYQGEVGGRGGGPDIPPTDVIMDMFDMDGDRALNVDEFVEFAQTIEPTDREELEEVFVNFGDQDANGVIDTPEIDYLLQELRRENQNRDRDEEPVDIPPTDIMMQMVDMDMDGVLNFEEFTMGAMMLSNNNAEPEKIAAIFSKSDTNADGSIDYPELEALLNMLREENNRGREGRDGPDGPDGPNAQELFQMADMNQDGVLNLEEFYMGAMMISPDAEPEKIAQIFSKSDFTGDGAIDIDELEMIFQNMDEGGPPPPPPPPGSDENELHRRRLQAHSLDQEGRYCSSNSNRSDFMLPDGSGNDSTACAVYISELNGNGTCSGGAFMQYTYDGDCRCCDVGSAIGESSSINMYSLSGGPEAQFYQTIEGAYCDSNSNRIDFPSDGGRDEQACANYILGLTDNGSCFSGVFMQYAYDGDCRCCDSGSTVTYSETTTSDVFELIITADPAAAPITFEMTSSQTYCDYNSNRQDFMSGGAQDGQSCANYIQGLHDNGTCESGIFMQYTYDGDCRCCDAGSSASESGSINLYRLTSLAAPDADYSGIVDGTICTSNSNRQDFMAGEFGDNQACANYIQGLNDDGTCSGGHFMQYTYDGDCRCCDEGYPTDTSGSINLFQLGMGVETVQDGAYCSDNSNRQDFLNADGTNDVASCAAHIRDLHESSECSGGLFMQYTYDGDCRCCAIGSSTDSSGSINLYQLPQYAIAEPTVFSTISEGMQCSGSSNRQDFIDDGVANTQKCAAYIERLNNDGTCSGGHFQQWPSDGDCRCCDEGYESSTSGSINLYQLGLQSNVEMYGSYCTANSNRVDFMSGGYNDEAACAAHIMSLHNSGECSGGVYMQYTSDGDCRCCDVGSGLGESSSINLYRLGGIVTDEAFSSVQDGAYCSDNSNRRDFLITTPAPYRDEYTMQTQNTSDNGGISDGFARVIFNEDGTVSGGVDYSSPYDGDYDESAATPVVGYFAKGGIAAPDGYPEFQEGHEFYWLENPNGSPFRYSGTFGNDGMFSGRYSQDGGTAVGDFQFAAYMPTDTIQTNDAQACANYIGTLNADGTCSGGSFMQYTSDGDCRCCAAGSSTEESGSINLYQLGVGAETIQDGAYCQQNSNRQDFLRADGTNDVAACAIHIQALHDDNQCSGGHFMQYTYDGDCRCCDVGYDLGSSGSINLYKLSGYVEDTQMTLVASGSYCTESTNRQDFIQNGVANIQQCANYIKGLMDDGTCSGNQFMQWTSDGDCRCCSPDSPTGESSSIDLWSLGIGYEYIEQGAYCTENSNRRDFMIGDYQDVRSCAEHIKALNDAGECQGGHFMQYTYDGDCRCCTPGYGTSYSSSIDLLRLTGAASESAAASSFTTIQDGLYCTSNNNRQDFMTNGVQDVQSCANYIARLNEDGSCSGGHFMQYTYDGDCRCCTTGYNTDTSESINLYQLGSAYSMESQGTYCTSNSNRQDFMINGEQDEDSCGAYIQGLHETGECSGGVFMQYTYDCDCRCFDEGSSLGSSSSINLYKIGGAAQQDSDYSAVQTGSYCGDNSNRQDFMNNGVSDIQTCANYIQGLNDAGICSGGHFMQYTSDGDCRCCGIDYSVSSSSSIDLWQLGNNVEIIANGAYCAQNSNRRDFMNGDVNDVAACASHILSLHQSGECSGGVFMQYTSDGDCRCCDEGYSLGESDYIDLMRLGGYEESADWSLVNELESCDGNVSNRVDFLDSNGQQDIQSCANYIQGLNDSGTCSGGRFQQWPSDGDCRCCTSNETAYSDSVNVYQLGVGFNMIQSETYCDNNSNRRDFLNAAGSNDEDACASYIAGLNADGTCSGGHFMQYTYDGDCRCCDSSYGQGSSSSINLYMLSGMSAPVNATYSTIDEGSYCGQNSQRQDFMNGGSADTQACADYIQGLSDNGNCLSGHFMQYTSDGDCRCCDEGYSTSSSSSINLYQLGAISQLESAGSYCTSNSNRQDFMSGGEQDEASCAAYILGLHEDGVCRGGLYMQYTYDGDCRCCDVNSGLGESGSINLYRMPGDQLEDDAAWSPVASQQYCTSNSNRRDFLANGVQDVQACANYIRGLNEEGTCSGGHFMQYDYDGDCRCCDQGYATSESSSISLYQLGGNGQGYAAIGQWGQYCGDNSNMQYFLNGDGSQDIESCAAYIRDLNNDGTCTGGHFMQYDYDGDCRCCNPGYSIGTSSSIGLYQLSGGEAEEVERSWGLVANSQYCQQNGSILGYFLTSSGGQDIDTCASAVQEANNAGSCSGGEFMQYDYDGDCRCCEPGYDRGSSDSITLYTLAGSAAVSGEMIGEAQYCDGSSNRQDFFADGTYDLQACANYISELNDNGTCSGGVFMQYNYDGDCRCCPAEYTVSSSSSINLFRLVGGGDTQGSTGSFYMEQGSTYCTSNSNRQDFMSGDSADADACATYISGLNNQGTCSGGQFMQYNYDGDCRCCDEGSSTDSSSSIDLYQLGEQQETAFESGWSMIEGGAYCDSNSNRQDFMSGDSNDADACASYILGLHQDGTCSGGRFMQYNYDGDCRCCDEGSSISYSSSIDLYELGGQQSVGFYMEESATYCTSNSNRQDFMSGDSNDAEACANYIAGLHQDGTCSGGLFMQYNYDGDCRCCDTEETAASYQETDTSSSIDLYRLDSIGGTGSSSVDIPAYNMEQSLSYCVGNSNRQDFMNGGSADADACAVYINELHALGMCSGGAFMQYNYDGDCRCCDAGSSISESSSIDLYQLAEYQSQAGVDGVAMIQEGSYCMQNSNRQDFMSNGSNDVAACRDYITSLNQAGTCSGGHFMQYNYDGDCRCCSVDYGVDYSSSIDLYRLTDFVEPQPSQFEMIQDGAYCMENSQRQDFLSGGSYDAQACANYINRLNEEGTCSGGHFMQYTYDGDCRCCDEGYGVDTSGSINLFALSKAGKPEQAKYSTVAELSYCIQNDLRQDFFTNGAQDIDACANYIQEMNDNGSCQGGHFMQYDYDGDCRCCTPGYGTETSGSIGLYKLESSSGKNEWFNDSQDYPRDQDANWAIWNDCSMMETPRLDGSCKKCKKPYVQSADASRCEFVGVRIYNNTGDVYLGRLSEYKRFGKGYYNWEESGNSYYGMWLNHMKHGYGIKSFATGASYMGEWRDDEMNGWGTYNFASGKWYNGELRDGDFNGFGTFNWPDGTYIEGEFRDDEANGMATKVWSDGSRYEGEWEEGYESGQGTRTYADGSSYTGEWKRGNRHGYGELSAGSNTAAYAGQWDTDEQVGGI